MAAWYVAKVWRHTSGTQWRTPAARRKACHLRFQLRGMNLSRLRMLLTPRRGTARPPPVLLVRGSMMTCPSSQLISPSWDGSPRWGGCRHRASGSARSAYPGTPGGWQWLSGVPLPPGPVVRWAFPARQAPRYASRRLSITRILKWSNLTTLNALE